jgi:hypothetical protein
MASSGPQQPTSAQRWAEAAHRAIEVSGPAGLVDVLADEFVQESHRSGPIAIRREGLLGTVRMMKEMGLHIAGEPVAVAGDLHLLMRRRYVHERQTVELLAISAWNADGRLVRLVEYDADALDEALAALAELSGEPVVRLDESG